MLSEINYLVRQDSMQFYFANQIRLDIHIVSMLECNMPLTVLSNFQLPHT